MRTSTGVVSRSVLTVGMVLVLGGCGSRPGVEYGLDQVHQRQQRGAGDVLNEVQIGSYPSNWTIEEVMLRGIPGLVLSSRSSGRSVALGSMGAYTLAELPKEYISFRGMGGGPARFVLDGVPVPQNSQQLGVVPSEVVRIEVLRDDASAAMYGFRDSAGVIVITTKDRTRRAEN